MSNERIEGFLGRWSRLKSASQCGEPGVAHPSEETDASAAPLSQGSDDACGGTGAGEAEPQELPKDFSDFDYETLSFESDYEQFMKAEVPDDVRNSALRKLWVSSPVLANTDGLDDYCEDYTDAAVCKGPVKTAYRFGRGFLSDAEVATWEALGKPVETVRSDDAKIAAGDAGAPPQSQVAAGLEPCEAGANSAHVIHEAGAAIADAGSGDWVETAATSGAGCAAALKAEEHAACEGESSEDA